jgi:predicted HTH domain antitoxin
MAIVISEYIIRQTKLTEEEFRLKLALMLFEKNILTFGQARRFSGLNVLGFQDLLVKNEVALHYDWDDYQDDRKTLDSLSAKPS